MIFLLLMVTGFHGCFAQVKYAALNVWPAPLEVELPQNPAGPHLVTRQQLQFKISPSCDTGVAALAQEVVGKATVFKSPTRTYTEDAYADADSWCPASKRCSVDSDCGGGACYIPSDLRWSSTIGCAPSTTYNAGCGCCVLRGGHAAGSNHSGGGGAAAAALPSITTITVTCEGDRTSHTQGQQQQGEGEVVVQGVDDNYWWVFNSSDCGYDDVTPVCSGQTVSECKAKCLDTPGCGGFNYPHGIMKKKDCALHRGTEANVWTART